MKAFDISKIITSMSFGVGTILFLTYLIYKADSLLIGGFYYVCIAFVINLVAFLLFLICGFVDHENRFEYIRSGALLLINIPIAIFYIFLLF